LESLLSGFVGAGLVAVVTILWQYLAETRRERRDAAFLAVRWADDLHVQFTKVRLHKEAVYTNQKPYLSQEQYNLASDSIRTGILRHEVPTRLDITYGSGTALGYYNRMRECAAQAFALLAQATQDSWAEDSARFDAIMLGTFDPLKVQLLDTVRRGTRISFIWRDLLARMKSRIDTGVS
jgi:hypothetical protein